MLRDKVVIVTGAGSGIGEGSAEILAAHGAALLLADRDGAAAERVADRLRKAGARAVSVRADVTDAGDVEAMVAKAVAEFGRLDGAFNNAGIGCSEALTADQDIAEFRRILEVDLIGMWLCLKYQIPALLENGGSIVVNASAAGMAGTPKISPYAAAKAGVINMVRSAAVEYAAQNIRFNVVNPGPIKTPAMAELLNDVGTDESYFLGSLPMKRFGSPAEVGEMVAFLLSDRAAYVTGQAIGVDGGFTASYS